MPPHPVLCGLSVAKKAISKIENSNIHSNSFVIKIVYFQPKGLIISKESSVKCYAWYCAVFFKIICRQVWKQNISCSRRTENSAKWFRQESFCAVHNYIISISGIVMHKDRTMRWRRSPTGTIGTQKRIAIQITIHYVSMRTTFCHARILRSFDSVHFQLLSIYYHIFFLLSTPNSNFFICFCAI